MTGSAALLAEALHSAADAGNELFLIVALRRSGREPDELHPFGYGAERYFWALLAALGMFVVGGVVSVWRGLQELFNPSEVEAFWIGVAVLLIALVLDGTPRAIASAEVKRRAATRGITVREYVRESADPTITTVYLEDTADVIGAALALDRADRAPGDGLGRRGRVGVADDRRAADLHRHAAGVAQPRPADEPVGAGPLHRGG